MAAASLLLLLLLPASNAIYCDEDDCYDLLGLKQDANASEIKNAYYKLSLKHHSDKNPDPESRKLFVKIANAYEYWKMSTATYPVLARMARDVLAIPASTVASESAFSGGERVINDYRSRLASETIETLICLQDWLKEDPSTHDDIAGIIGGDDQDNDI